MADSILLKQNDQILFFPANYIHWRFVKDLGGYTNQQMTDLAFAFSSAYYGTTQAEAKYYI